MSCSEGLVKLILFAVNLVFALAGLGLVILGACNKVYLNNYNDVIPDDYQSIGLAPILTITIGAIIFLIAFFGCCGAIKESPCLLTTYAVILLVIFLAQLSIGIFAFLEIRDEDDIKEEVTKSITTLFNKFNTSKTSTELVNVIQTDLECCGVDGDIYWRNQGLPIPDSCKYDDGKKIFKNDCVTEFYEFLKDSAKVIGITVLSLSAFEVITAVFSLCLSSSIKNRERRFRY